MTQLKRPFAVRFKHPWSSGPIWETFWTQTAEMAIVQARTLYSDISGKTEAQIIKVVPLAMNEAIIPPDTESITKHKKRAAPPKATPSPARRPLP